jgi:hypothetical protein
MKTITAKTPGKEGTLVRIINREDENGNFGKTFNVFGIIPPYNGKGQTCYVVHSKGNELTYIASELKIVQTRKEWAKKIAGYWHGGQWSTLYQFASSGIYMIENALLYLVEIQREIELPEYALRPFDRSKKDANQLLSLKKYFEDQAKKEGINITWQSWKAYGTMWPITDSEDSRILGYSKPI